MKQQRRNRRGDPAAPSHCDNGDWMLQKADAIKGFLAQQRGRSQQSSSKTAWLVAWEQLAAEGELASKQVQQVLQPSPQPTGCSSELSTDIADLAALHEQLESQEQQLQLLGQVQDLCSLAKRASCMGTTAAAAAAADLLPAEAAALASLQQELNWLQQDTQQGRTELAAAAQGLIVELTAAVAGSAGASAGMMDWGLTRVDDGGSSPTAAAAAAAAGGAVADAAGDEAEAEAGAETGDTHAAATASIAPAAAAADAADAPSSCRSCWELHELLLLHPLAPASLQQQLLQAYGDLQQQHQQQLQDVTSAQQALHKAVHDAGCAGTGAGAGQWTGDQHALFVWLRGQALQKGLMGDRAGQQGSGCARAAAATPAMARQPRTSSCSSGSSIRGSRTGSTGSSSSSSSRGGVKASVLDYLLLRMPGRSRQQLEAHEAWYTTALQLQRRADDLQDSWQRQKAAFLQAASDSLAAAAASTAAAAEAAAARLSAALSRQLLHEQLEGIQCMKQQQAEVEAAREAAAAAVAAARAAAEAAARQERCEEQRALVLTHKQQVAQEVQQAEAHARELQAASAHAAAQAVEASKPTVAARQADALQRLQQQQERQRQRAADAAARQQRLAAIAAAFGPQLDRDPQRVLQATAASAAAAPVVGAAFRPVHGFTAQQVMADPRFRLVEALREAGALRGGAGSVGYLKQAMARLQG